jgi:preprotein translocase subunit SecA
LGKYHYEECVIVLSNFLKNCHDQSTNNLAGMAISALLKLNAIEEIDVIRDAFERECVELGIAGDIEDVEIGFGIRMQRSTPRPRYHDDLFGIASIINDFPKAGRNDPCPCGSGKKFKKCCLH